MPLRSARSPGSGAMRSASTASPRALSQSPVCHATILRSRISSPRSSAAGCTPSSAALAPRILPGREARDLDRLGIGSIAADLGRPRGVAATAAQEDWAAAARPRARAPAQPIRRRRGRRRRDRRPLGSLSEQRDGVPGRARADPGGGRPFRERRRHWRRAAASAWVRRSVSSGSRAANSSRTGAVLLLASKAGPAAGRQPVVWAVGPKHRASSSDGYEQRRAASEDPSPLSHGERSRGEDRLRPEIRHKRDAVPAALGGSPIGRRMSPAVRAKQNA